jgi:hypothetical protein
VEYRRRNGLCLLLNQGRSLIIASVCGLGWTADWFTNVGQSSRLYVLNLKFFVQIRKLTVLFTKLRSMLVQRYNRGKVNKPTYTVFENVNARSIRKLAPENLLNHWVYCSLYARYVIEYSLRQINGHFL